MRQSVLRLSIVLLIGNYCAVIAQPELEKVEINKDISLLIPKDFVLMSRSEQINKYVSSNEPLVMYTSEDRNIDFGITLTNLGWAADDMQLLMEFYISGLRNLFSEVEFIQQEVREINGREFIVLEFISKASDDDNVFGGSSSTSKYTYIQYTLFRNQVMLFNLTAPAFMRSRWEGPAKEMMESIRIK